MLFCSIPATLQLGSLELHSGMPEEAQKNFLTTTSLPLFPPFSYSSFGHRPTPLSLKGPLHSILRVFLRISRAAVIICFHLSKETQRNRCIHLRTILGSRAFLGTSLSLLEVTGPTPVRLNHNTLCDITNQCH